MKTHSALTQNVGNRFELLLKELQHNMDDLLALAKEAADIRTDHRSEEPTATASAQRAHQERRWIVSLITVSRSRLNATDEHQNDHSTVDGMGGGIATRHVPIADYNGAGFDLLNRSDYAGVAYKDASGPRKG